MSLDLICHGYCFGRDCMISCDSVSTTEKGNPHLVSESSPPFPPLSISFTLPASCPTPVFKRFGGADASALETCSVHEAGAAESGAPGAGSPQEYGVVQEQLSVLRPQTRRGEGASCQHTSCRWEKSLPMRLEQPPFQRTWLCKHAGGWLQPRPTAPYTCQR